MTEDSVLEDVSESLCPKGHNFPTPGEFQEGLGTTGAACIYFFASLVLLLNLVLFLILLKKFLVEVPRSQVPNLVWVTSLFTGISFFVALLVFLPKATEFLLAAYRVYEAFVICRFVELNLMWYGGEKMLMNNLGDKAVMRFNLPPCCCCFLWLRKTLVTRKRIKFVRFCVNQMVYIHIFVLFIQLVLEFVGVHDGPSAVSNPHTYFKLIGKLSFFFGLWSLFVFFTIERTFKLLDGHKYMEKFTIMKITLVIFILQETIIEGLASKGLIGCTPQLSDSAWGLNVINSSLLMVECSILGIASFLLYFRYPNVSYATRKQNLELTGNGLTTNI